MYVNALDLQFEIKPTKILFMLYLPILVFLSIMHLSDSVSWEKGTTELHYMKIKKEREKVGRKKGEEEGKREGRKEMSHLHILKDIVFRF